jgi:predicted DCC family thiol-disulfide oxidoreductase YuxK
MAFTLFYDGLCPLCEKEIKHLRKYDSQSNLQFVDIMADDFAERYPQLDWKALDERIHGMCRRQFAYWSRRNASSLE